MKEFYNAQDVQKVTGCSRPEAYKIIRQMRESFEIEYPEAITIQGKIPIWYANERLGIRREYERNSYM